MVEIKDTKTDMIKIFYSNVQAAKYLKISRRTIYNYKKSKNYIEIDISYFSIKNISSRSSIGRAGL